MEKNLRGPTGFNQVDETDQKARPKIGIILPGDLERLKFLKEAKCQVVKTPYGKSWFFCLSSHQRTFDGKIIFLFRHADFIEHPRGTQKTSPHKINYQANIYGFKKLGVKLIIAFNSVGSLKRQIKPGTILIPSDFIDFNPPTFFDNECHFITPEISQKGRAFLKRVLKKLKIKFRGKGIYFQTKGPRLETKAEINLIKNFADVVGMTMAKEATLAKELDLEYVSLCSVDNYAHGLTKKPLIQKEIEENQKKNLKKIKKIIEKILICPFF
jgi:5'-methylthioadenosine phosphorylase